MSTTDKWGVFQNSTLQTSSLVQPLSNASTQRIFTHDLLMQLHTHSRADSTARLTVLQRSL